MKSHSILSNHMSTALEMTSTSRYILNKNGFTEGPVVSLFFFTFDILETPFRDDLIYAINSRLRVGINAAKLLAGTLQISKLIRRFLKKKILKKQKMSIQAQKPVDLYFDQISMFDERADKLWVQFAIVLLFPLNAPVFSSTGNILSNHI